MKLELRHISGYLQYNLKVQFFGVINSKELSEYESKYKKENPEDFFKETEYNPPKEIKGLKVSVLRKVEVWKTHTNYMIGMKNFGLKLFWDTSLFKPVLRPLSDLRKDKYFSLYLDLCDELGLTQCEHLLIALEKQHYYAFDIQKYESLEDWMYKNHFDWKHNLIGNGLAIDINTLP